MSGAAAVAAVWLLGSGVPRLWRAAVFVPLLFGALGLLQARAQTCVALAARGQRNMDGGAEAITDAAELREVKAQARRVNVQAVIVAAAATIVLVMLP
jgi:hypothetical protein